MKSTVERAFELAKSNECQTLLDIKQRLAAEHHTNIEAHFAGTLLRKQLTNLMLREPRTFRMPNQ